MCPSSRDKAITFSQAEEDDFFYADGQLSALLGGGSKMDTADDYYINTPFISYKKELIQEATLRLEKMVCKSEELDRHLDQQKRK